MSDFVDTLKSFHTALVDSRNGYAEGLKDAESKALTPLFHEMIDLRNRHHAELDRHLLTAGEEPDEQGSFMSTVHRTVIKVRSVLTGLDKSALPGLIDGEERIVRYYDEALAAKPSAEATMLSAQRSEVVRKVEQMKTRERL